MVCRAEGTIARKKEERKKMEDLKRQVEEMEKLNLWAFQRIMELEKKLKEYQDIEKCPRLEIGK